MENKIDQNTQELLAKLTEKYDAMGQDLSSYLNGLLHTDYLTYWDYIHLDTLLSLQQPKTAIPDEKIFILYHQITELYFRLILNELEQITTSEKVEDALFLKRLKRVNRYFKHLIDSFDVMIEGMDHEQFLSFRMALLPASGFQSVQYRMIEVHATDFFHLAHHSKRATFTPYSDLEDVYNVLYWKAGATELATGKKTLTLKQFEKKYGAEIVALAADMREVNLLRQYTNHYQRNKDIIAELKTFDLQANVEWPMQHLKSASRYLKRSQDSIKASGGTNWQKYLPPKAQKVIFYPELWTEEELGEWGIKFSKALIYEHS